MKVYRVIDKGVELQSFYNKEDAKKFINDLRIKSEFYGVPIDIEVEEVNIEESYKLINHRILLKGLVDISTGNIEDSQMSLIEVEKDLKDILVTKIKPYYFINLAEVSIESDINQDKKELRERLIESGKKVPTEIFNNFETYEDRLSYESREFLRKMNQKIAYSLHIKLNAKDEIFKLLKEEYELMSLSRLEGDEELYQYYLENFKLVNYINKLSYEFNLEKYVKEYLTGLIENRENEYRRYKWRIIVKEQFTKENYQIYSGLDYDRAKILTDRFNNDNSSERDRRLFLEDIFGKGLSLVFQFSEFEMKRVD